MEMPEEWRVEGNSESTCVNLQWWENLGDPVLNELIVTALQNNKDLQVAIWKVCEFYAQFMIARSPLFPQIGLNASGVKERFSPSANFLPQGINPVTPEYTFNFTLSYEIDFWGQVRNASKAAYSEFLAQIENRRTVVLTLVSAVAEAYIFLRQLDLELEIALATLESRRESLQIAKYRFEGGVTSEIEVTQAEFAYQDTLGSLKQLERLIPQQENLLSILLGQNPGSILRGKSVYQLTLPKEVPMGLPSDLLERRPDILQAENQLIAANANIGVARAAFFPQISLTGLFGGDSFELKKVFTKGARTWQIGGTLLQQIFTGGALIGQLRVTEAQKEEAIFGYEQTILNAFREVDDALIGHKKAKEEVIVRKAEVDALKEYLHLAWLRYYEGETQYLTVLDAERQLFAAEIQQAETQGDLFTTLVQIYKALGGGWVVDADSTLITKKE
jgi:multidrug efflux system outer membrane protein